MDAARRQARFLKQVEGGSRRWGKLAKLSLVMAVFFGLVAAYGLVSLFIANTQDSASNAVLSLVFGSAMVAWQMTMRMYYQALEDAALHFEGSRAT